MAATAIIVARLGMAPSRGRRAMAAEDTMAIAAAVKVARVVVMATTPAAHAPPPQRRRRRRGHHRSAERGETRKHRVAGAR